MKIHTNPKPVVNDGATVLGAITGAIAGASVVFWILPSSVSKIVVFVALALLSGVVLGFFVGFTIGRMIDRLAPKLQQAILDSASRVPRQPHRNKL